MLDRMLFVRILPKCPKHPKYEAKRKPRAECEACQKIWEIKNEDPVEV